MIRSRRSSIVPTPRLLTRSSAPVYGDLEPRYVDGEKMRWTGELLDARGAREGRLATEWCGRTAPTGLDEKGSLVTTCPFISTLLHRSRISVRQLRRYLFDCKTTHGREFVRPREVMGLQREKYERR